MQFLICFFNNSSNPNSVPKYYSHYERKIKLERTSMINKDLKIVISLNKVTIQSIFTFYVLSKSKPKGYVRNIWSQRKDELSTQSNP